MIDFIDLLLTYIGPCLAISEVVLVISDVVLDIFSKQSRKSPQKHFGKWVLRVSSIGKNVGKIVLALDKCPNLYRFGKANRVE